MEVEEAAGVGWEGNGGVGDVINDGMTEWRSRPDLGVGDVTKVKVVTWGEEVGAEGRDDSSGVASFRRSGDGCPVDLARRVWIF